jgi:lipopolysaccharide/colanic/teichoic acid biosynthesis glycosyltransferase
MIRFFDIVLSLIGMVIFLPLIIIIYLLIIFESRGGGIYFQERVGKDFKLFRLYKFRSMCLDADKSGLITIGGRDPRMTRIGIFIRRVKIDELPQLFNVLKGDMSMVGPRPEVRKYVDMYNPDQKKVLSVRPGITDYASIDYVDENVLLGAAEDPERMYIETIMPDKIRRNMRFVENQTVKEYFKIIFLTVLHIIR